MREIKFRKWYLGEMDYSPEIWADGEGGIIVNYHFKNEEDGIWMQYTGLKDKNGVEIYEGDIVEAFSGTQRSVVKWNDQYGLFETTLQVSGDSEVTSELLANHLGSIVIIGNKYLHPHLLESEDRP
ncbi:YopX family protein [Exiguobacterium sp.]|uniref:YopX family protein n=1 Tax=Exiguobacterium sp. TaxID=44751 RepID=UPI0028A223C2|nr:YopX family protein [Exiguobacterium sp.]